MESKKHISAGAGERMQYIAHKYNDTTIRFILYYPGLLNAEILSKATKAVIDSVDVLHASFIPRNRTSHWKINSTYNEENYFAITECEGNPVKPAQGFSLRGIDYKDKCQMQVTLVQSTESCAVVVRISHLVVDGSDGKYLLNKLAESYRLIEKNGTAEGLELKNGSRSATNAYNDLGVKELASLAKNPFAEVKTEYPFADAKAHGPLRMLHCTIPAEVLGEARRKAKAVDATVNDLLLTACYRAYARTIGKEGTMSISGMMDLRSHCKDGISSGLSNLSGGLGTSLNMSLTNSFQDDLVKISVQTKEAKNNPLAGLYGMPYLHAATKTFPMWLLLQAADMVYSSLSLSMTNLGNIALEPLTMNGIKPTNGIFGGPLKKKPSVQVGIASFDGTAELTILGDFVTEDIEGLQKFLNGIRTEVEVYLEEE